jgi:glycosyltransferase involved in cell wall biosynthesis
VVAPSEPDRFLSAARELRHGTELRERMGTAARAHAERAFDIEAITDRFLEVIAKAVDEAPEVRV